MKAGSLGVVGAAVAGAATAGVAGPGSQTSCILLFLVGGPSHLDTWDMKPEAPAEVRGPFRPIATTVPGIQICEHLPRMARLAHRYVLIRSVHHREAPIHETGHQLMQTGRLFRSGVRFPHYGSVVSRLCPPRSGLPPFVLLPRPIGNTGVNVPHGQDAGFLGTRHDPFVLDADPASPHYDPARLLRRHDRHWWASDLSLPTARTAFDLNSEPPRLRQRYGSTSFGQSCLLARRLIERGVRLVAVNMFDTVFNRVSWDCHANGGSLPATLEDYKRTLCPVFDLAYTALLEDLSARGLLDSTLVVAMGEFGRSYRVNARGGRDHWPGVWTVVMAGGGVVGGRVIGSSDRYGAEPKERPVLPADIAATIYRALGIDPATRLPGPDGQPTPLSDGQPIMELFA